jgi:rare lipoprotein A (peptidoglycan hydrolase)
VNLAVTVALLPALFLGDDGPDGPIDVRAGRAAPVQAAAVTGEGNVAVLGPNELAAAAATTTTTTTAPPPPKPKPKSTSTTSAPRTAKPAAAAPAPAKPATTPTTQSAAPQPAPAAAQPTGNTESGKASWYDHQPGICAHKTLPFGTVVTVTNTANGKRTTCTVGDRGPYVAGWVIDLNPREFEQLAPRSAGVISVRLDW